MKNKIAGILFLSLITASLFAQTTLVKSFNDQFSMQDCPHNAKPTPDGGMIITGFISDSVSLTDRKGFLLKLDAYENIEWAKYYDPGTTCFFTSVELTADSSYLLIGTIFQTSPMPVYSSGIYVVKTDLSGNVIWSRCYGGYESVSSTSTYDNGFLITGQGFISAPGGGSTAISITRLDNKGDLMWSKAYAPAVTPASYQFSWTIDESPQHDIYIGGSVVTASTNGGAMLIVKADSSGFVQWAKTYDEAPGTSVGGYQIVKDICADSNGDLLVTGYGPGAFLMKLRADGSFKWGRTIAMANFSMEGRDVIPFNGGYAVAYTNTIQQSTGIAVTDIDGRILWAKEFPGLSAYFPYTYGFSFWQSGQSDLVAISANDLNKDDIFLLRTNSDPDSCSNAVPVGADTTYVPDITDIVYTQFSFTGHDTIPLAAYSLNYTDLVFCGALTNSVAEPNDQNQSLILFPNPASDRISIDGNFSSEYIITNLLGQKIIPANVLIYQDNQVTIDISELHSGLYFISDGRKRSVFVKQ